MARQARAGIQTQTSNNHWERDFWLDFVDKASLDLKWYCSANKKVEW